MHLISLLSDLGRGVGGQHQLPSVAALLVGHGHLHLLRLLHAADGWGPPGLVESARPAPSSGFGSSPANQEETLTPHPEVKALKRQQVRILHQAKTFLGGPNTFWVEYFFDNRDLTNLPICNLFFAPHFFWA